MFDPLDNSGADKSASIPLDLVPSIARRTLRNGAPSETFDTLYKTVIDNGMTSEQKIAEALGKDTLRALRSPKSGLSPARRRLVLEFIAALDPEAATARKERWRHANPRPREERDLQPL
ncbi:MAG TPA: hypothetical protein VFS88_03105 [Micavibrio sp.]|nr:hypothetical protein [Micavibrio sp.]